MAANEKKRQAHELIDRLPPRHLSAVLSVLEAMLDPVAQALQNAPEDDEPEGATEAEATARSRRWLEQNQGIPPGAPDEPGLVWVSPRTSTHQPRRGERE